MKRVPIIAMVHVCTPHTPERMHGTHEGTGDCSIATYKIDKDCVATKRFIDSTKRKVVSVGTSTHPKWHLYSTWATKKGARIVGSVECPCTASNGNPMDYPTALSHILGQMGAMGLDAHIAKKVATKAKDWKGATEKGATYVTSLGVCCAVCMHASMRGEIVVHRLHSRAHDQLLAKDLCFPCIDAEWCSVIIRRSTIPVIITTLSCLS